ncbi:protein FAM13A-like isoform X2 [Salminus brasiliensis]|uniref:protein FAM13A-like isoform X2 n=1 Tax=Salminus brasiliensis TaxID=930266 RepID=UPI003B8356AB
MGAGASISLCQTPSSVRVLKHSARVEPEPRAPEPVPGAVFGVPLSKLREAGKLQHGVPLVLKHMVEFLETYGLQQSGVFRVCGSAPRCRTLRVSLDRGERLDLDRGDVPTVAALLKLFLRELPCGLIPNTHSKRMQQALIDCKGRTELFEALKETLNRLPDDNYNILSYLLHFLSRVAAHSQWNHMTSENLATVFGPCIFRVPEGPKMLEEQTACNTLTLHLLEKHTHLIPNTHSGDLALPPPPLTDMSETQSCNLGTVCDSGTGESQTTDHSKDTDTRADLLTAAETQTLSNRLNVFNGSHQGSEWSSGIRRCHYDQSSSNPGQAISRCGPERAQLALLSPGIHTFTSASDETREVEERRRGGRVRQAKAEPPSPNHNNNNIHSHTSNTDGQNADAHSQTRNSTGHTRSKARKRCVRSHTCTPNRDTPNKTTSHKHSGSSDALPETSSSHRQSSHSPTADTHTQEQQASPLSSCDQHTLDSRACVWKSVSSLPSPHCPIPNQNWHLSSEEVSLFSSSQLRVMSDCISSGNSADDSTELSISLLQRHIHNLRQAIDFEGSFQYTQDYKAGNSDQTADPKAASLMTDFDKARRQLRDLQSRQCVSESKKTRISSTVQQGVSVPLAKPALEDTVKTLTQHLKEKRLELNLPERLQDMSLAQLALEKMTLQKSLLYYESLHGRPRSKEERSVMRDLYDRYRLSEDKGSDKLIEQTLCSTVSVPTQEASNPAFISQLGEVKLTTAPTNNTHSFNRAELLRQLKETRVEKRRLKKILKEYEETVRLKTGRSAGREDRLLMAAEYDRYKTQKARLKLLKRMLGQMHTVKAAG